MLRPERVWFLACKAYQKRIPLVPQFLKALNYFVFRCITPYQAKIEPDLILDHYGLCFVAHPNVEIGRRCRIYHGVTLAAETPVGSNYKIRIGNDVMIGVGATIIARTDQSLSIGDGAAIGAGAVVTKDVEAGTVVVGIPAQPLENFRRGVSAANAAAAAAPSAAATAATHETEVSGRI